jgi:hypothetical protein
MVRGSPLLDETSSRRTRRLASGRFGVAALCLSATTAYAGPPFLTDDPDPVDLHHLEINAIYQATRTSDGRSGTLGGELNYGCARETQCHVALPVAFDHPSDSSLQTGLGDVEAGVKYRFFDQDDPGWSAAVYPTVTLPTGDASRSLGNGRAQLLLPLWVQRSAGAWHFDAGVSWLANPAHDARDSWFAGLLGQRAFGDAFTLGAEVFRRTSTAVGVPTYNGFNVGAIVKLAPHSNLLASAGRGFGDTDANRGSLYLAYQLEL